MQVLRLFMLIAFSIVATQQLAAQNWPRLDTLYTLPVNPGPTDSILLIYQITHNYSVGTINQQLLSVNNIYSLNVCQQPGIAAVISTYRDTTVLPPQPAGNYQVNFNLQQGYWYSNISYCQSNGNTFVQGNHNFVVSPILQLKQLPEGSVQFSPNPVGAMPLSITTAVPITSVQCYHSSGALVYEQAMAATYYCTVPFAEHTSGLYYLVVQTEAGRYTQKIIRQ